MDDQPPNHYETLGLDRRCTTAQVRTAYRILAKRHHPDLHPDSPAAVAQARELNLAHEVLSDPTRRRAYDRELDRSPGRVAPVTGRKSDQNVSQDVHLRVDELIRGASLEVRVKDPANPRGDEVYPLLVPPETAPGARFRLLRAEPFEGGYVQVRIRVLPNARFKSRGTDLRYDLRIHAQRAAQGGSEMIPSPVAGMLRVQIPAGIARGSVIRIPGEGLPKPRGGRGDLLVRVTYRPEVRITRSPVR